MKKRERTANLVTESETLETQNLELKSQIQELERMRVHLVDVLTRHRPHCQKKIPTTAREYVNSSRLPSVSCAIETVNHSYNNRQTDIDYQTQIMEMYNRPANNGEEQSSFNNVHYLKPPSVLIDCPPDNYEPQLINLDNSENMTFNFNHQQCHNYNSSQTYGNSGMDNGCMA